MPRPKVRQAPFATFSLIGPGFRGLNTEAAAVVGNLDPGWALVLDNVVFDDNGRLASRKGWVNQTTTPATGTPDFKVMHEYLRNDTTVSLIGLAFTGGAVSLWESTDDGATWADITGSLTSAVTNWQFVNFNDHTYACGPGSKVWQYTGTGTFTEVTGSPVTSGVILAAFGRIWVHTDATSDIQYSQLLDATEWVAIGAGTLSLDNVWTQGTDTIRALTAFGASMVVFAENHIVIYVDGSGSVLGIDPDNMYVVDTIEGTGTKYRDSVVRIGEGDIWFMGSKGLQSLARAISDKVNPLTDISKNVRSQLNAYLDTAVGADIEVQGVFSPENDFVLYTFPESNEILLFDTKARLDDGTYRVARWTGFTTTNTVLRRRNGDLIYGQDAGVVAKYTGYRDGASIFDMVYASPWLDGGAEGWHNRYKIVKQFYGIFYGRETLTATARWAFDFRPLEYSETFTNDYLSSGGEFAAGEFGEDEFGTGSRLRRQYIGGQGDGQYVKLWLTLQSTDVDDIIAIQELGFHTKIGRAI
jgi:hypothetical protein